MNINNCPKCKNEMEKGILLDQMIPFGYAQQNWASGYKWLLFTKNKKKIDAYKCKNCGYIECYAT